MSAGDERPLARSSRGRRCAAGLPASTTLGRRLPDPRVPACRACTPLRAAQQLLVLPIRVERCASTASSSCSASSPEPAAAVVSNLATAMRASALYRQAVDGRRLGRGGQHPPHPCTGRSRNPSRTSRRPTRPGRSWRTECRGKSPFGRTEQCLKLADQPFCSLPWTTRSPISSSAISIAAVIASMSSARPARSMAQPPPAPPPYGSLRSRRWTSCDPGSTASSMTTHRSSSAPGPGIHRGPGSSAQITARCTR